MQQSTANYIDESTNIKIQVNSRPKDKQNEEEKSGERRNKKIPGANALPTLTGF